MLSTVAHRDLAGVGERHATGSDEASVHARWSALAAHAAALRDSEPAGSAATLYRPETWRAIYALEAAIAQTDHPDIAEWAVSSWLIEHLPIAECVHLERAEHPRPRTAHIKDVDTESRRWHHQARAEAFRAAGLPTPPVR